MLMQTCFKCNVDKPLDDFYRHPRMASGRVGKCKECNKADVIANRLRRVEYYRKYDIKRNNTVTRRQRFAIKNKAKQQKEGPAYLSAHNAVARAVKRGALIKPKECQRCKTPCAPQGHHDDYAKPLDVMWLCPICHAARHRELGRLGKMAKAYGEHIKLPI